MTAETKCPSCAGPMPSAREKERGFCNTCLWKPRPEPSQPPTWDTIGLLGALAGLEGYLSTGTEGRVREDALRRVAEIRRLTGIDALLASPAPAAPRTEAPNATEAPGPGRCAKSAVTVSASAASAVPLGGAGEVAEASAGEGPTTCARCERDFDAPESRGYQPYSCVVCHATVCADCSENASAYEVICDECATVPALLASVERLTAERDEYRRRWLAVIGANAEKLAEVRAALAAAEAEVERLTRERDGARAWAKEMEGACDSSHRAYTNIREAMKQKTAAAGSALSAARRRIELLEKTQASGRPDDPQSTVAAAPNGLTGSRGEKP